MDYATKDADGIVRPDLLLTMSEGLNRVTAKMEQLGLVILKDENGEYVARGNRNIKINGENFKPLLADAVSKLDDVTVINQLNITRWEVVRPYFVSYTSPCALICFAPTPCAIVPVGAIVSLQRRAIKRISNVVISAPASIPMAYPAPVLNGGYHIL